MFSLANEHSVIELLSALLSMCYSISNVTWGTEYMTSWLLKIMLSTQQVIDVKSIPLPVPHIFHNLYSLATPSVWHIGASLYEMDDGWVKPVQQSVEQELNSDHDPRVSKKVN